MFKVIFTLALFAAGVLAIPPPLHQDMPLGESPVNFEFVGEADGKQFFAEASQRRNWFEAKECCESNGMRLASITSEDQYAVLLQGQNLYASYWVSLRDAHSRRQLSWDDSDTEMESYLTFSTMYQYEPQTCGNYHYNGVFYSLSCLNEYKILCEKLVTSNIMI